MASALWCLLGAAIGTCHSEIGNVHFAMLDMCHKAAKGPQKDL